MSQYERFVIRQAAWELMAQAHAAKSCVALRDVGVGPETLPVWVCGDCELPLVPGASHEMCGLSISAMHAPGGRA